MPLFYYLDDDSESSDAFLAIADECGTDAFAFATAAALLERFSENTDVPSALILDPGMPHTDGLEFMRFLRFNKSFRQLPFIVVSGESQAEHIDKCFEAGACLYVLKSQDPDAMRALWRKILAFDFAHM